MKHKTLRTLLCVILTVCFCLSAIVPASAAGLFGGESGIASQWDQWIRSLKDRFTDTQPGTEEIKPVYDDTATYAATNGEFMRIFHLDCGRRYFSVKEITTIIDYLAENHYTHIELGFGNDGFRFLLDNMEVVMKDGTTYSSDNVKAAIQAGNTTYSKGCSYYPDVNELTQEDMDAIISYAKSKQIGVIPLIDIPGHSNALIDAMNNSAIGINVTSHTTGTNIYNVAMRAFDITNATAVEFVSKLVGKYIDYFAENGSKYFNLGADECGYTEKNGFSYGETEYTALAAMLNDIGSVITSKKMTPMVFNDGFRKTNGTDYLQDKVSKDFVICYWTENSYTKAAELAKKFNVINTHNGWYYVVGNDTKNWAGYYTAIDDCKSIKCTSCDSGYTTGYGCMLAVWCDQPKNEPDLAENGKIHTLIKTLAENNPDYFKESAKPTITASKTSLPVGDTATVTVSNAGESNIEWSVTDDSVLKLVDTTATNSTAANASVQVKAIAEGTSAVNAVVGATKLSVDITVSATRGDTQPQTITLTVGGTDKHTQDGENFSATDVEVKDTNGNVIATYTAEYKDVASETKVTLGSEITTGTGFISDGNGNYMVIGDNGVISNTKEITKATEFTVTSDYYRYYIKGNDRYLKVDSSGYGWNKTYTLGTTYNETAWTHNNAGWYNSGYLVYNNGWTLADSNSSYPYGKVYAKKVETIAAKKGTEVTFTGEKAGYAEVTINGVLYKVTVTAEDLSNVSPLPIQLWITNIPIEVDTTAYAGGSTSGSFRSNNPWSEQKAWYVSVSANDAYGENGVPLSKVLPESMTRYENNITYWIKEKSETAKELVLWSGRIHTSSDDNIQKIWDVDYSNSGTEFNYVRYYKGVWEVSETGRENTWVVVTGSGSTNSYSCSEQLAVYYMIRSTITDEVTTDVADWGYQYGEDKYTEQVASTNTQTFVLLDFAVKYESGTRTPDEFPVDGKTFAFHCKADDAAVGTDTSGNYYRRLNNFRAVDTSEYEVYMVTVTMTSDEAGTTLTSTKANTKNGYKYAGEEQVLWAIDQETRDAVNLNDYTSISGSSTYSGCKIGGDPYIRGVEVYRQHGALITYYVRVKEVPVENDVIHVHYIDKTTGEEFYTYPIIVIKDEPDGLFDEGFGINSATGVLEKNTVKNHLGKTQTVESDLRKMYGVPAQYRYSEIKFVDANLGTGDTKTARKDAYLYYEFSADVSFVVDFGLPLTIKPTDVNASLANATVTNATVTGTDNVTVNSDNTLTYHFNNKTLDAVDMFTLKYDGSVVINETTGEFQEGSVEYKISIIPATNVYYEENFITNNSTNNSWTLDGTLKSEEQTLEKLGNTVNHDIYGYDSNIIKSEYKTKMDESGKPVLDEEGNPVEEREPLYYSMGQAYKAELTIPSGKDFVNTKDKLTFTFKGTGFDLISGCGANTGMLTVNVINSSNKRVKTYVVDTYFHGDSSNIMANGTTTYQVPVVRNMNLPYDTYTVTVYGSLWDTSGAVIKSPNPNPVITQSAVSVNSIVPSEMANQNDLLRAMLDDCGLVDVSVEDIELVYMDEDSILNGGSGMDYAKEELAPVAVYSVNAVEEATDPVFVWVDAFRVYNPLGTVSENSTYTADHEAGTQYVSLFDSISEKVSTTIPNNAVMYVEYDGTLDAGRISEYRTWGPENEIYLAPGQGIAFGVNVTDSEDFVLQLSAKIVNGDPSLTIGNDPIDIGGTEMYYDISTSITDGYVVIKNVAESEGEYATPDAVLAISGLKFKNVTFTQIPEVSKQAILKSFAKQAVAGFEPVYFTVSNLENARKNRNFAFNITASACDVKTVTIQMMTRNGEENKSNLFTLVSDNSKAVAAGITSNNTYSKIFRVNKSGTYTFDIVAYNEAGQSKTITKTVVVK